MLGDQWNLTILQHAFLFHARTFSQWRDDTGISESVLALRLRELVAAGLLSPQEYTNGGRTRNEYRLTPRALELWEFLSSIWMWERRWADTVQTLPRLTHLSCGESARLVLACKHCDMWPITAAHTQLVEGSDTFQGVNIPRHHKRIVRTAAQHPASYLPHTMGVLGDRWSTMILAAAFLRIRRFRDFRERLDIAPSILSNRLQRLVEFGILRPSGERSTREYRLTDVGRDCFPVFATLISWANDHFAGLADEGLSLSHELQDSEHKPSLQGLSSHPLATSLVCAACGEYARRPDLRFETDF